MEELISEIADLALTLSLIVAIIFGMAQINVAKKDRRERLTLETLRNFHSRDFAELIFFITTTKMPDNYEKWQSLPNEDRIRFIQITQQMESLGILLADGLIDIELMDKTLGSFISTTWDRFSPLIIDMREKINDPYLSEYFQWMSNQVQKKLDANQRKPFFETNAKVPLSR
jgi:hypothetical protein